jgi:hypothetical protein
VVVQANPRNIFGHLGTIDRFTSNSHRNFGETGMALSLLRAAAVHIANFDFDSKSAHGTSRSATADAGEGDAKVASMGQRVGLSAGQTSQQTAIETKAGFVEREHGAANESDRACTSAAASCSSTPHRSLASTPTPGSAASPNTPGTSDTGTKEGGRGRRGSTRSVRSAKSAGSARTPTIPSRLHRRTLSSGSKSSAGSRGMQTCEN